MSTRPVFNHKKSGHTTPKAVQMISFFLIKKTFLIMHINMYCVVNAERMGAVLLFAHRGVAIISEVRGQKCNIYIYIYIYKHYNITFL